MAVGDGVSIEAGALQHVIAAHYPLHETAAAHDAVDSGGFIGKVVVNVA
ncbi:MAG: zinc-binding dehydrogenase [Cyanobacteria bacterium J06642_11]